MTLKQIKSLDRKLDKMTPEQIGHLLAFIVQRLILARHAPGAK